MIDFVGEFVKKLSSSNSDSDDHTEAFDYLHGNRNRMSKDIFHECLLEYGMHVYEAENHPRYE